MPDKDGEHKKDREGMLLLLSFLIYCCKFYVKKNLKVVDIVRAAWYTVSKLKELIIPKKVIASQRSIRFLTCRFRREESPMGA